MSERTQNKIKEFKAFNTEEKKQKLLAVFEYIKDKVDFADNAIAYLQDSPEDLVMEKLYETVLEYAEYIKDKENEEIQEQKGKLIQESEETAQKDSDDADKLLSGLMDLI